MLELGKGELLTPQDRMILESAETMLQPDRPDRFDLNELSEISGIKRTLIQERFPFPELLALGIVVMLWEEKTTIRYQERDYCLNRPNGFRLKSCDWKPDPELLNFFSDHSIVEAYNKGEPFLGSWFRKSEEVS